MNQYIPYLLAGLFTLNLSLYAGNETCPTKRLYDHKYLEVEAGTTFEIHSIVQYPYFESEEERDKFQWLDEDDWKIVGCDWSALQLIKKTAWAPDGGGRHLRQCWQFKARKAGIFKITFQRYQEQFVSEITVSNSWFNSFFAFFNFHTS